MSWNVGGHDVWSSLSGGGIDVALLQEARVPSSAWPRVIVPPIDGPWRTAGWTEGSWSRRTAIVQISDSVQVAPIPVTTIEDAEPGAIPVSRQGTLAAARVTAGAESFIVVSVYGMWERPADGRDLIYADGSAHRLLSDLASLVTTAGEHRLIVAGDLNILRGYGEGGHPYWAARYATVFDRAEAMGLRFIGPQSPNGRKAAPHPEELPQQSGNLPTYHTASQGPLGATRQLDFVFASTVLADRLRVSALNNDSEEWGPSDHCRVVIDLDM